MPINSFEKDDKARKRAPDLERDENGHTFLTEQYIKEICDLNGQFETPYLNDTLYLHFKGFAKIECLEKYTHLKSIWLECNGLKRIEGLDFQYKLRMLMLHQNTISKIENICHLTKLVKINLSQNFIKKIEGLKGLDLLTTIDLSGNLIPDTKSCEELLYLPSLASIDLKNNVIDDGDNIVPFFSQLKTISSLYLKGNPGCRHVSMYRKNLTSHLPILTFLDERPIMELDRLMADAWLKGGVEAEKICRQEFADRKLNWQKHNREENAKLVEQSRVNRKNELKKMLNTLKGQKDEMIIKRKELREDVKAMRHDDPDREMKEIHIRKIDMELKTEFYKILEDRGEEIPSTKSGSVPTMESAQKINDDYNN